MPSPRAISGISPMIANSLVPIANPPMASANRTSLATRGGSRRAADDAGAATVEGAVELMARIVHCSTHQDDEAPPTAHGTLWCARMRTRGWGGSFKRGPGCFGIGREAWRERGWQ